MFVFLALSILYPNDRLSGFAQRRYDMRHEMLTQRAPFCIGAMAKKGTLSQHFVTHVVPPLGFAMATKTCGVAKLYQRPLNSMRSLSVLN